MLFISDDKMAISGTKIEIMAELSFLIHKLLTYNDEGKNPVLTKDDVDDVVEVAVLTAEEREELEKALKSELKEMFLNDLVEGFIHESKRRRKD